MWYPESAKTNAQHCCASFSASAELPENGVEPSIAGPADRQSHTVAKNGGMAVFCVEFQLGESIDIQNVRAMNANELRRIETRFDLAERLLLQKLLPFRAERHVIVLRFHVIDL